MTKNKIIINPSQIEKKRITYSFIVEGEVSQYFKKQENFWVEYSIDISDVPESIAVIPLLANILPVAWVFDAEISVPVCDSAFYGSVPEFNLDYSQA